MAPEVHPLSPNPIADHSFTASRQTLAITRDTHVELFRRTGSTFAAADTLRGHDKTVTSVDIAPISGRIVTCSQDRNALVWTPNAGAGGTTTWTPTLVLLRLNRAATTVRWSPLETKFAVGSGARLISICSFEADNDWWVSKHLKRSIRSTVTCVAWHPDGVLLAAGGTDACARVFSAFVKGVDDKEMTTGQATRVWGEKLPFGTVCGEFVTGTAGWVHAVAFSPRGEKLAFAGHDSRLTIVYPGGAEQAPRAVVSVSTQLLPFRTLLWTSEDEIVAAGYDCEPFRFRAGSAEGPEGGWKMVGSLEAAASRPGLGVVRADSAMAMFRQMDLKGKGGGGQAGGGAVGGEARGGGEDTALRTTHQNTIVTMRSLEEKDGRVTRVSTTGADGRLAIWTL